MPDDPSATEAFEQQIKSKSTKTWYWLRWDGTVNKEDGTFNKKNSNPSNKALFDLRKKYREDLRSSKKSGKNKKYIKFWDTYLGRKIKKSKLTEAKNIQRFRTQGRISVRTKDNTDDIANFSDRFSPAQKQIAWFKTGIKRFHLVESLMLRIYKKTGDTTELQYQEILGIDDICSLYASLRDPDKKSKLAALPKDLNKNDVDLSTLSEGGEYYAEIWITDSTDIELKNIPKDSSADDNQNFIVGRQKLHNRSIRDGGKKNAEDISASPAIKIPGVKNRIYAVLPGVKTAREFIENTGDDATQVGKDITRKINFIAECIKEAQKQDIIKNMNDEDTCILALPEWYFQRTTDSLPASKLFKGNLWSYTKAEKKDIIIGLQDIFKGDIIEKKKQWVIVPGTILWGEKPEADDFGQSIVFNTTVAIWQGAAEPFSYDKSRHGLDSPFSFNIANKHVEEGDKAELISQLNGKQIPNDINDYIGKIMDFKGKNAVGMKTVKNLGRPKVDHDRWLIGVTDKGNKYSGKIILYLDGNTLKFIPTEYFSMILPDTEWNSFLDTTKYKAKPADYKKKQHNFFKVNNTTFGIEICTEAEDGTALFDAGKDNAFEFKEGVDCHIVVGCGSSPNKYYTTAGDLKWYLYTDGEASTYWQSKTAFPVQRTSSFEDILKKVKSSANATEARDYVSNNTTVLSSNDYKPPTVECEVNFNNKKIKTHIIEMAVYDFNSA